MKSSYLFGVPTMHTYFVPFTNVCIYWGVLHIYKKLLEDVFIQYEHRYKKSNILFIDEGQYHSKDNNNDNCFKFPSSWTFDGSYERDRNIKIILCSFLNHFGALSKYEVVVKTIQNHYPDDK
jgi:hypothetical protein